MEKKTNYKYKNIVSALVFVLYVISTGIAIWFYLVQKEVVFSSIFAALSVVFVLTFSFVLQNREVTLNKHPDGTVKCLKCYETAKDGKIYCKKHTYLNRLFFVLKSVVLNFLLSAVYVLFKNYHKSIMVPVESAWLESLAVGLITTTIYAPFYIYVRHGGRESTESTMLDITYIESTEQENEERKESYKETIRNEITSSITDEPQKAKIPTKHSPKVAIVAVLILLIASIGFNVFLFQRSSMNEQRLSEAQVELSKKQDEIKSLEWDAEYWRERRDEEEAKRYQEYSKYIFLYRHAACINEEFIYYHHPDCEHFDKSSFYIQNTEWAENEGYKPCPYCWTKN